MITAVSFKSKMRMDPVRKLDHFEILGPENLFGFFSELSIGLIFGS